MVGDRLSRENLKPEFPASPGFIRNVCNNQLFSDVYMMMYDSTKDLLKGLIAGILFGGDFGRPELQKAI